jgi:hypothetical protein
MSQVTSYNLGLLWRFVKFLTTGADLHYSDRGYRLRGVSLPSGPFLSVRDDPAAALRLPLVNSTPLWPMIPLVFRGVRN